MAEESGVGNRKGWTWVVVSGETHYTIRKPNCVKQAGYKGITAVKKVHNYIALTFQFQKEGRRWVGVCQELGTSTYSRSLPETEKHLLEAVCLHLNTLEDVGERERFFKENSIKTYAVKPTHETIRVAFSGGGNTYIRPHIQSLAACAN